VAEFIDNLGIAVYEGYGMTESSGCTTTNRPGESRLGSVGKPVPGVEVKIDTRVPGAGEGEGEIIIYGSGVMAGYHNRADITHETIMPDRGLRTGDLGRLDADGYLYVTGRVKELYKLANGKYVAPAPLEEKLQLSPYIAQCVVYGADQPHNVAMIVPDLESLRGWAAGQGLAGEPEELLLQSKVRDLYKAELESHGKDFKGFERIRDFFFEVQPLTIENGMLTPTMKLKRREVMKRYEERLRALYRTSTAAEPAAAPA
jgi:long-chain acyl-CoA synthetase